MVILFVALLDLQLSYLLAFLGRAVVYAATALPFTIYLLSGYFSTLAHDYEEAAYIDGAGYGRTMIKIIFPMAQPSIITIIRHYDIIYIDKKASHKSRIPKFPSFKFKTRQYISRWERHYQQDQQR